MPKRTSGAVWKTKTGDETVSAFMPCPLPPRNPPLQMTEKRKTMLSKAEEKIKRINLSLPILPSSDWISFSFMRKESVVSAQIEGTQSTLVDLLIFEATREKGNFGEDLEDILAYLKAFKFVRKNIRSPRGLPLSIRLLNDAHRIILQGSCGREKTPGSIRFTQNWIQGTRPGNAAYVPPPPENILELMSELETYMYSKNSISLLIRISLVHAQFETTHPYLDGNGRLGRLLISILLEHWGVLSEPVVYLSFFSKETEAYTISF